MEFQNMNLFYINLIERTDRKAHIEDQLEKTGFPKEKINRFNAVKMDNGNGALGCSFSHLKCIQIAKEQNLSHVCVFEDDATFVNPAIFIQQVNHFLKKREHQVWDVLLLGGNNMWPFEEIDNSCIKVSHCLTTTAYIVKNHYFDILIQNFKDGIKNLLKYPELKNQFAIDKFWICLQEKDKWYLLTPIAVYQREDYSDIEKK